MATTLLVLVSPESVDVFERIDLGHGRIVYERIDARVIRAEAQPASGVLAALLGGLFSLVGAVAK
jgi:hypothetical protein